MFHIRCYTSITVFTHADGGAALAADSSEGRCWVTTRIDSSRMWQQAADQCRYCTLCCLLAVAFLVPCKMCPFLRIFHTLSSAVGRSFVYVIKFDASAWKYWNRNKYQFLFIYYFRTSDKWPTDWQSNKIARMRSTNLLRRETEQCTVLTFSEPMCELCILWI